MPKTPRIHFQSLQKAFNEQLKGALEGSLKKFVEHLAFVEFSSRSTRDNLVFVRGELIRGTYARALSEERGGTLVRKTERHTSGINVFDLHTHIYEHGGVITACPSEGDLISLRRRAAHLDEVEALPVNIIAALNPHHREFNLLFFKPTNVPSEEMPGDLSDLLDHHFDSGDQPAIVETIAMFGFKAMSMRKRRSNPNLSIADFRKIAKHFKIHGIISAAEKYLKGGG